MSSAFALSTRKCLPPLSHQHSVHQRKRSRVEGGVGRSENCDLCNQQWDTTVQPAVGRHRWHNIDTEWNPTPFLTPVHCRTVDISNNTEFGGIRSIISGSSRLPDILNYEGDIKLLPHQWFINIPCYFDLCSAAEFRIHALNCNGCRPAGQGEGEDGRGFTETGTDPPSQKKSSLPTGF